MVKQLGFNDIGVGVKLYNDVGVVDLPNQCLPDILNVGVGLINLGVKYNSGGNHIG